MAKLEDAIRSLITSQIDTAPKLWYLLTNGFEV